jgi:hypothetical protein
MSIGVTVPSWLGLRELQSTLRETWVCLFVMDIIVIMCWSIWKEGNALQQLCSNSYKL